MTRTSRARKLSIIGALGVAAMPTITAAAPIEVAHEVKVDFGVEAATLVVQRSVRSDESDTEEAHFSVESDYPLAGTGLRTRGDDGKWYAATLRPVDEAIETYWMLTGSRKIVPSGELAPRFPSMQPKDPALMMWSPRGFDIYAFPVALGQPRTVEYTLAAPYYYLEGAHTVHVPVGDDSTLPPVVRIGTVPAGYRVFSGEVEVPSGNVITRMPAGELALRLVATRPPQLRATLAATRAGERQVIRVEVEAGARLGPEPANTHAVVVLDRSRSMTGDGHEAARQAAFGYLAALAKVPGAKVEVVLFDRSAVRTHGRFVAPAEALVGLEKPPPLANGSDLAQALELARSIVETAPGGAPRRVIVVSDAMVDPDLEGPIERALGQLRAAKAIVHVADVAAKKSSLLEIDEDHRWRMAVAATGGLTWRGSADVIGGDDIGVFAEWVRPGQVHGLSVRLDGVELEELDLAAGEGRLEVDIVDVAPRRVTARGWVWGTPIAVDVARSEPRDRAWTVLAAAYVDERMSDAEVLDVATRARAVSAKTAYLALEPGAKPGQAVASGQLRTPRIRSSACGGFGGHPVGRLQLSFDESAFIREAVATAARACRAREGEVEVTTTFAEVVAIPKVEIADKAAAACVRERLWELEFPPGQDVLTQHAVAIRP